MVTATQQVTVHGKPLTLEGRLIQEGDRLPQFELTGPGFKSVKGSDFEGKIRVIATVPCLSTSVCDTMTRRFNEEASKLGSGVVVITVSADLPQTQENWCGAAGIKGIQVLSDHKEMQFAKATGLLIKEWREFARAVLVVDKSGVVRYVELLKEIANEPDYRKVIEQVKSVK